MKTYKNFPLYLMVLFAFITLFNTKSMAQINSDNFFLKGSVSDSLLNKKLPFATIKINDPEGQTIKTGVGAEDGTFNIPAVSPSHYRIEIIALGYEPKTIFIDFHKDTDLGLIKLKPQVNVLEEVSVTANVPIIEQKADRIIYNLQADPESKSNSVLGMMHKIPYISLDGNDNIMLKGNSSFKVLINGKPSASMENNLNAILKSMPASTIEKIEVITIPPSKYDGEGLAGIINIITVKKLNDGYSGSLNANGNFPVGGPGVGGSYTTKINKFAISAYGGGGISYNPQTTYTNSRLAFGENPTNLLQQGDNKSNNKSAYFGTEMSYEIDSLHLISAQLNMNGNHSNADRTQTSNLTENEIIQQAYDLYSNNKGNNFGIDAALNYQMGFKAVKDRFLTFSYQFSDNQNNRDDDVTISNQTNFTTPNYKQHDRQKFNEHTMQVDFVTPVKKVNIEAGVKAILRNSNSDFGYTSFNELTNQFEPDPALSNQYSNTQNVFSAYNSYQINLESWNINAGVRLENTVIRADFISNNTALDQNYLNFLPSVAIGKNFKDNTSLNFGFSQRIRRPGINRLNPYIDRSNPNFEITGNPDLRPVLVNDFQIGYGLNKKVSLNIGLNYSFMNNLDLQVIDFDPITQITRTTYENTGKSSNAGGYLSVSYPVTKTYSINLNGNATYLWLQGIVDGKTVNNNRLMYSLSFSNGFRFDKGWAVNADLNVISRTPTGLQGYSNGFVETAFSVNKELVKNKLVFSAQVKNPFTKFRNNITRSFGPNFDQSYSTKEYFRSFGLSLNYKFGGLNGGVNKSKKSIINDDLAN